MRNKLVKKIRQQTRRQRKGYSLELARELVNMSRWERLKYCWRIMNTKKAAK